MDARVNFIILPLAGRLMPADQAKMVTGEGTLDFVILHEISHGLGPTYVHGSKTRHRRGHRPAIFRARGIQGRYHWHDVREMAGRSRARFPRKS